MRAVKASLTVPTDATRALTAFVDPIDLKEWWGVERALIEPRDGGVYLLAWGVTVEGFQYVTAGTIGEYEPSRVLRIDNYSYMNPARRILGPMRLAVRATIEGNQTRLDLQQDGYQEGPDWDWYYDAVVKAWPVALLALRTYLEKEKEERRRPSHRPVVTGSLRT